MEKPSTEVKKDIPVVNLTEGIENEAVKVVALDMFKLARSLKERASVYNTIVSDDSSGRLVSLFLKKVFDGLRKKENQLPVQIRFLASGRGLSENKLETIKDFLSESRERLGKVLLVTEYIETGKSIAEVIEILNTLQIDFDLAALTVSNTIGRVKDLRRSGLRGDFFFGNESYSHGGINLHGRSDLSGVIKQTKDDNPFPERFKDTIVPYDTGSETKRRVEKERLKAQKIVNQTRKDIGLLAKKTVEVLSK